MDIQEILPEIIATAIGIAFVALRRYVDRLLPDPDDRHPFEGKPRGKHAAEHDGEEPV